MLDWQLIDPKVPPSGIVLVSDGEIVGLAECEARWRYSDGRLVWKVSDGQGLVYIGCSEWECGSDYEAADIPFSPTHWAKPELPDLATLQPDRP